MNIEQLREELKIDEGVKYEIYLEEVNFLPPPPPELPPKMGPRIALNLFIASSISGASFLLPQGSLDPLFLF